MANYLKLGLLGHPLSHSLSPILQSAALQFAGINGQYNLFDIKPEFLTDGIKEMLASGVRGFNVTIPYKQEIYKMVDSLTEEARLAGAVNTVKVEDDGKLSGHNTDIIGFKLAFTEAFGILANYNTALIIGAGGSARAVLVALAQLGFKKAKIKGQDPQKVRSFITEMRTNLSSTAAGKDDAITMSLWENGRENKKPDNCTELDLVVNASPIGLKDENTPEWLMQLIDELNNGCLCFDLVYSRDGNVPTFTNLALSKGLRTIDGLPMLIHQARYAFEFWTKVNVPTQIMNKALQL